MKKKRKEEDIPLFDPKKDIPLNTAAAGPPVFETIEGIQGCEVKPSDLLPPGAIVEPSGVSTREEPSIKELVLRAVVEPVRGVSKRPLPIAKNMPTKAERGTFRSKRGPFGR